MLGKVSRVDFKKTIPFQTVVEMLGKEGFEPQYRMQVHPVISELGIRPEPFYMTELLTKRDLPKTLVLLAENRQTTFLDDFRGRRVVRDIGRKHGPLSMSIVTAGVEHSNVRKAHQAILAALKKSWRLKVLDIDKRERVEFEKNCQRTSPTGQALEDPSVTKAIEELKDGSIRQLTILVKINRLIMENKLGDIASELGNTKTTEVLKRLEDLTERGVLERIVVSFCCERLVSIVGSENKASTYLQLQTSCPQCHKPLTRDKLIRAYRLQESAGKAIDQSTWLVGYVASALAEAGCSELVSGRYMNGDEVDLAAFYLGRTIVVECSDKSIELGDVYKFNGKLSTINSWPSISTDLGIVVTTDRFNQEAENFLKEGASGATVHLVQGNVDTIRKRVLEIMDDLTRSYFERRMVPREYR